MEYKLALQFPRFGQAILPGQHRKIVGIGISFFIHVVGVCSVVFMSSVLSDFRPPLRIDFSIYKTDDVSEVSETQKVTRKVEHKQENVSAEVQQMAAPQEVLPEKVKVLIAKKIVPRLTKKKMVTEVPPLAVEKEVVAESVKEVLKPLAETLPKRAMSSIKSATVPASSADKKMVKTFFAPEKQYLKEHFLYIKNNVQNKISYPSMARKMGWQGRVLISFVVCKDGSVKDIRIIESSGFKVLDKNAVEVIQKTAPFPKPPVSAELIIPVTYKLS